MANKDHNRSRNRGNAGDQPETGTDAGMGESGPDINPESTAAADAGATGTVAGPSVDTGTGEMTGNGFDQQAATPPPEVIHMPKKIVAKEIIPRAKLKGGKTWIPGRNPTTNELLNDGSGVWKLDDPKPLYTVFGTATATKTGETAFGVWTGFLGQFEAVRAEDGVRFRSSVLMLQDPAQGLLLAALQDAKSRDKDASISFAFNVGLRTSERWAKSEEGNSYEYTVDSVINVERTDPLAHLRNSLQGILPKQKPKQIAGPGSTES